MNDFGAAELQLSVLAGGMVTALATMALRATGGGSILEMEPDGSGGFGSPEVAFVTLQTMLWV